MNSGHARCFLYRKHALFITLLFRSRPFYILDEFISKMGGGASHFLENEVSEGANLLSESELLNYCAVTLNIGILEILEKVTSLTYHLEKSATAVEVLLIVSEMRVEVVDSLSENSDLNLRRAGVALVHSVSENDFLLLVLCEHSFFTFL